jgi:hypothetical protein
MPFSEDFQHVPPQTCPWCGYVFDAVSQVETLTCTYPEPGDMLVCIACAQVNVVVSDWTVRRALPEELDTRTRGMQADIRRMHARLS